MSLLASYGKVVARIVGNSEVILPSFTDQRNL
jgi:hypothetical protein